MKKKFKIYDIIIYIVNHLKDQEIKIVFMYSDWTLEIDSVKLIIFLFQKKTKWESTAAHNQHQNEISECEIQIILYRSRYIIIETNLFKIYWAEELVSSVFLTDISFIFMKLFSEFFTDSDQKSIISYKVWHDQFYSFSKSLKMIKSNAYKLFAF